MSKQYEYKNEQFIETTFDYDYINKSESLMCQGNGYLSIRGSLEEQYNTETRDTFISDFFNKPQGDNEVAELPNIADFVNVHLYIDGRRFSLETGILKAYKRVLTYKTGELIRTLTWISPTGVVCDLSFKRFVSYSNKELFVQEVGLKTNQDVEVKLVTSLDGNQTSHGVQHFIEGEMKYVDHRYAYLEQITSERLVPVYILGDYVLDGLHNERRVNCIGRRDIVTTFTGTLTKNKTITFNKRIIVSKEKEKVVDKIQTVSSVSYNQLLNHSIQKFQSFWDDSDIEIEMKNGDEYYQSAIRFTLYHLRNMNDITNHLSGIGAKGFSGEDYKGHSFWDTEIYIYPFWLLTNLKEARNLLKYRYSLLDTAKNKAIKNGYKGAQYPWETASADYGECTPDWGNIDAITGEREPIWTGYKQIHITSDIVYAIWKYFTFTKDIDFMDDYGFEMICETAIFWLSRLEYNEKLDMYEITDVIGPDEYKEFVSNNNYTNYLAKYNLEICKDILKSYRDSIDVQYYPLEKEIESVLDKIKIQKENEQGIIPQDDTYLTLADLPNFDGYKNSSKVLTIFKDYSMTQVRKFQVSKQADIVALLLMFPNVFDQELTQRNFDYYESKTLHDSSLSNSLHGVLSGKLKDQRFRSFIEASFQVDFNQNSFGTTTGIHSAAMGGLWQVIVFGILGFDYYGETVNFKPNLPEDMKRVSANLTFEGSRYNVTLTNEGIKKEKI